MSTLLIGTVGVSGGVKGYDTEAELLVDTPSNGTIGYARDTGAHFFRQDDAWEQAALADDVSDVDAVPTARTVTAGAGLTGGGDLTENRTIDVGATDGSIVVAASGIKVTEVGLDLDSRVRAALAAATANVSFNSKKLIDVADPTSAQHAATKAYVDTLRDDLPWIDPIADFGAVGDDATDDTDAIDAAIAAIPTGGARILVRPGKIFRYDGELTPPLDRPSSIFAIRNGVDGGMGGFRFTHSGTSGTLAVAGTAGDDGIVISGALYTALPARGTLQIETGTYENRNREFVSYSAKAGSNTLTLERPLELDHELGVAVIHKPNGIVIDGTGRTAWATVEGVKLYGSTDHGSLLEIYNMSRISVRDVYTYSGSYGFRIGGSYICSLLSCKSFLAEGANFKIDGNETFMRNCQSESSRAWGLHILGSANQWLGDISGNGEQESLPAKGGGVFIDEGSFNRVVGYWESTGQSEVLAHLGATAFYNTIDLWRGENAVVQDLGVGNRHPAANSVGPIEGSIVGRVRNLCPDSGFEAAAPIPGYWFNVNSATLTNEDVAADVPGRPVSGRAMQIVNDEAGADKGAQIYVAIAGNEVESIVEGDVVLIKGKVWADREMGHSLGSNFKVQLAKVGGGDTGLFPSDYVIPYADSEGFRPFAIVARATENIGDLLLVLRVLTAEAEDLPDGWTEDTVQIGDLTIEVNPQLGLDPVHYPFIRTGETPTPRTMNLELPVRQLGSEVDLGAGTDSPEGSTFYGDATFDGDTAFDGLATFNAGVAGRLYNPSAVLNLGSNAATSHGLGTSDALVGGSLEVNGTLYADGPATLAGITNLTNLTIITGRTLAGAGGGLAFVSSSSTDSFLFPYNVEDQILLLLGSNQGRQLVIGDTTNGIDKDFDHNVQTNPALFIHSAVDPDSDNTQYLGLYHNQTDAVFDVGKGNLTLGLPAGKGLTVNGARFLGRTATVLPPTTTEFPTSQDWGFHDDTNTGKIYLAYNRSGVIKSVELA